MSNKGGPPLDGKFYVFYNDLVAAKSSVGHASVIIYTDANGTQIANDNNGNPIDKTVINYTIYTYGKDYMPTSDNDVGFLRIVFKGNSRLEIQNTETPVYWYSFYGGDSIYSVIKPLQ